MISNIRVQRTCQFCGVDFEARKTTSKTCSDKCAKMLYKRKQKALKVDVSNTEMEIVKSKPLAEIAGRDYLSITDTGKLLGVSKRTVYRLIERGGFMPTKIGSRSIFKRSEIDRLFL